MGAVHPGGRPLPRAGALRALAIDERKRYPKHCEKGDCGALERGLPRGMVCRNRRDRGHRRTHPQRSCDHRPGFQRRAAFQARLPHLERRSAHPRNPRRRSGAGQRLASLAAADRSLLRHRHPLDRGRVHRAGARARPAPRIRYGKVGVCGPRRAGRRAPFFAPQRAG